MINTVLDYEKESILLKDIWMLYEISIFSILIQMSQLHPSKSSLTLPTRIDVTSWQLISENFQLCNTMLIPDTIFIKIASPNSVISAAASLKIRARFRFSHKSVKIKLLNT